MNFKTWWESEERDADWYLPILAESAWNAALASGYTADARLVELLEAAHSELQWWAAQDIEEPACVTATLDRLNDALMLVRSNDQAQGEAQGSSRLSPGATGSTPGANEERG